MLRRMILPMFVAGVIATPVLAQQQPGGDQPAGQGNGNQGGGRQRGQGGGPGGGGPGGGGAAQFRQRMMDQLKEQLGTNDDEWKVVEPKIQKVMDAQRDARAGGIGLGGGGRQRGQGGGPGGGGQGGGNNPDQPLSPVQKANNDLRTALENKSASTEEITQKLTALRDAREKAHQSLTSAQKDLKEVLTPRQEAVLVSNGMLD